MRFSAALVFLAIAGRGAIAQSAPKAPIDSIPASVRFPQYMQDIRAEVAPIFEMEELPPSLHVKRLDSAAIPRGSREIRIYVGSIGGYPATGVILTDSPGRTRRVTGRMFRYWPVNDKEFTEDVDVESRYAEGEEGRCSRPVRSAKAVTCDVIFVREPDWVHFLDVLDSAQAWTLPDETRVPRRNVMMIHGWRIRAETKRDTAYRLWWYENPQLFRPPEGTNALRIMNMVYDLYDLVKLPDNIMFARGIYLFGRDTSLFTPCATPEKKGNARGALTPIQKLIGDSAWKAPPVPAQGFEVAGWFTMSGKRTAQPTWWADTLTSITPAPSRACAAMSSKRP